MLDRRRDREVRRQTLSADCDATDRRRGRGGSSSATLGVHAQLLGWLADHPLRVRVSVEPDRALEQLVGVFSGAATETSFTAGRP